MKKSLHIDLPSHFRVVETDIDMAPMPAIAYAPGTYYGQGEDQAIAQEFDGRYGYLYRYELTLAGSARIPLRVERGDLHVLYLMEADGDIVLEDAVPHRVCTLSPGRGRYLYLPPGVYRLRLPPGRLLLFGFYFDGGIFREGNERHFPFLHAVIRAYRSRSEKVCCSRDFRIGPRTQSRIQHLCDNLRKDDFSNESFVIHEISKLIELSREKVFDEYERTSDPQLLIQRCRELLAAGIAREGNAIRIKDIAGQLRVRPEYLNRLHKEHYQQKISSYRNRLLLEKIKALLAYPSFTLLEISMQCGFHGVSELSRFFRKHSQMTPGQYRRLIRKDKTR